MALLQETIRGFFSYTRYVWNLQFVRPKYHDASAGEDLVGSAFLKLSKVPQPIVKTTTLLALDSKSSSAPALADYPGGGTARTYH